MTEAGTEQLVVDDLAFEVRRSGRRKTVEITVDRGGELVIASPPGTAAEVLADFVREKRFWVYTKLAEKEARAQPVGRREFISGEGFSYLGRSYRLLLVKSQDSPLKLEAGRFRLLRSEAAAGKEHFVRWYTDHAGAWLRRVVREWGLRLGVAPGDVVVRDLGFRWGSCGRGGTLNFHWATILMPPTIAEYVVVHELVHLHEMRHTAAFWSRLERAIPDYEPRKMWLAEHGGRELRL